MPHGIFVTGGTGFVGRHLLNALRDVGTPVFALARAGTSLPQETGITVVTGDLLEPETYRNALRACDVVIHLAAATGRASAEEHVRVNARGTEILIEECRQANVQKLLFVSSIATTFPDKTGYHYAEAKSRAEDAVSRSGLQFIILRPTIIVGPGAPVVGALEKLALLPFIVLPGNGRVRVQPIHVDDVVGHITEAVRRDHFANETINIGGPDTLTMEAWLQQIRRARTGRTGRVLHIPLGLISAPLRLAEAIGLGRMLPLSAGQLSSFRFDGIAANPEVSHPLDAECRVFTRHLLGCDPDEYVVGQYRNAHAVVPALAALGRFDSTLIAFARFSPLCAHIADSYAGLFQREATLRKKLVMLLAILETRPPFHQAIDAAVGGSLAWVLIRLSFTTGGALLGLLAGTLIFVPARVVLALVGKGAR